jgi:hypothetical protein
VKYFGRVMLALGLAFAALGFEACAPAGSGSSGNSSGGYPSVANYRSTAAPNRALAPSNPSSDSGTIHLSPDTLTDSQLSQRLTDYLHGHRLPLVGAHAYTDSSGSRQVVLYGFVATTFGQRDASSRTRSLLNDAGIEIVNRIKIDPSLMAANGAPEPPVENLNPDATGPAPPSSRTNGVQAYENQGYANQPYGGQAYSSQQQNPPTWMTRMVPMLTGGMGLGSGGMSGFGGVSNSFGYSSPSAAPYPGGYPTPYSPFVP